MNALNPRIGAHRISDFITGLSVPPDDVSELESAASNRIEMRDAIAKLWGFYPEAETLGELSEHIKSNVGLAQAIEALTVGGASAEEVRAQLKAKGLIR